MPAVDQGRELDRSGTPEVDQSVEGGPDRAAGEEDVVHQDDGLVLDRERDVGAADHGRAAQVEVVAVERDVERAHGQRGAVDARDLGGQPLGEGDAAGAEPDEREIFRAVVPLEDLVRDAGQRTIEGPIVEDRWTLLR